MPGKIFYRERRVGESGFEQPRYQLTALAGVNLELYGKHLRLSELRYVAAVLGAELILLPAGEDAEERIEIG